LNVNRRPLTAAAFHDGGQAKAIAETLYGPYSSADELTRLNDGAQ
jgi:hypothetical protein